MISWIEENGLRIGTFPALEILAPALRVWFTTRRGGVSSPPFDSLNLGSHVGDRRSDVLENRRRLKNTLGIGANRVARGGQVHGTEIVIFAAMYTGDMSEGEIALAPLREIGTPIADVIGPHPFVGWQQAFDPLTCR